MDCTVVIRGPLYDCSLDNINKYVNLGLPVVVSHWESGRPEVMLKTCVWDSKSERFVEDRYEPYFSSTLFSKLQKIERDLFPDVNSIINKYINIDFEIKFKELQNAKYNVYQFYSTLAGLKMCNSKYVICMRSDMPYPNLDILLKKMKANPQKIIASDTIFRHFEHWKYHPGSHVIAGRRDLIEGMYTKALKLVKNQDDQTNKEIQKILAVRPDPVGEQVMGCLFLTLLGEGIASNNRDLMKKHFDIIKVSDLGGIYRNIPLMGKIVGDVVSDISNY